MKVLMINGSPRKNGNTFTALSAMREIFAAEKIDTHLVQIGSGAIRGCIACDACRQTGRCAFDDLVNRVAPLLQESDGLVVGSPVYYASANASLIALLDRLFHSTAFDKTMKVGASVAIGRRGGLSSTFDELNKFFTVSGMPVASSQYWNSVHGGAPEEALQDAEGMQTIRVLARNMAFLLKSIALGKETYGLPPKESRVYTNFVR
ncbi:MAG: flavodoxin family protein [Clostridiales bacterium]|nr:flavodoxin family protein [Bacillota bacterium]NLL55274.1 flavodoxin family protein [Clostridiales bacterium]